MPNWTRRAACRAIAAGATTVPAILRASSARSDVTAALTDIERRLGGRLGVAVGGEGGGPLLGHRANERFPMCSTFKVLAAAAVLARVDAGTESLDRPIRYRAADLLSYAPVTRRALDGAEAGQISVAQACGAAIVWSDNTAANLLLAALGSPADAGDAGASPEGAAKDGSEAGHARYGIGPAALTAWLRRIGDPETRLDRTEPDLNTAIPDDPRDTTTPEAMRATLRRLLLGDALSPASRARLEAWMVGGQTGFKRLRAGLPSDWRVGDKTGSGDNGTVNDVAILRPVGRSPVFAAVYVTGSTASAAEIDAAYERIGRTVAEAIEASGP